MISIRGVSLVVGLCLGLSGFACSSASPEDDGVVAVVESRLETTCANSSVHGCWESGGNVQSTAAFAFIGDAPNKVFDRILDTTMVVIGDNQATYPVGFTDATRASPKSIATFEYPGNNTGTIFMLGTDNVLRGSAGNRNQLVQFGGTNFGHVSVYAQPHAATGETLLLKQIAAVQVANLYAVDIRLFALTTDDKFYMYSSSTWIRAADSFWLANLPVLQAGEHWSSIRAQSGPGGGATILSSLGNMYRIASGTIQDSGDVTLNVPLKAKPLVVGGRTLKVLQLGGRYAITDAGDGTCTVNGCSGDTDRIYSYDFGSQTWSHAAGSTLPYRPAALSDLGYCGAQACDPTIPVSSQSQCTAGTTCRAYYPFYLDVMDLGSKGLAVRVSYSRIFRYRP